MQMKVVWAGAARLVVGVVCLALMGCGMEDTEAEGAPDAGTEVSADAEIMDGGGGPGDEGLGDEDAGVMEPGGEDMGPSEPGGRALPLPVERGVQWLSCSGDSPILDLVLATQITCAQEEAVGDRLALRVGAEAGLDLNRRRPLILPVGPAHGVTGYLETAEGVQVVRAGELVLDAFHPVHGARGEVQISLMGGEIYQGAFEVAGCEASPETLDCQ